ncbi:sugar-binding transcriptional regulator [Streptococcus hongkongensis]|nr:DeoR faimly transcriptional regulator [Streptococcus uberis]
MKDERKRLLAKIAYMYYIEEKSQTQIAKELSIYRTTICRHLAKAKSEGIVRIEISDFDTKLFQLEDYVRQKYGIEKIELVADIASDRPEEVLTKVARAAAELVRQTISDGNRVGLSWGSSISSMIDELDGKSLKDISVLPLAGGPSHINAKYHVNTLVYRLARIFHGESTFINAMVIQENVALSQGISGSKYFQTILKDWQQLDLAIVGIGGEPNETQESQWRDLLTAEDYEELRQQDAVGEICCRFFNEKGQAVYQNLQDRTIGIDLEQLREVPKTIAIASGTEKAKAIQAALKSGVINCLVTDRTTILAVLALEGDKQINNFLAE